MSTGWSRDSARYRRHRARIRAREHHAVRAAATKLHLVDDLDFDIHRRPDPGLRRERDDFIADLKMILADISRNGFVREPGFRDHILDGGQTMLGSDGNPIVSGCSGGAVGDVRAARGILLHAHVRMIARGPGAHVDPVEVTARPGGCRRRDEQQRRARRCKCLASSNFGHTPSPHALGPRYPSVLVYRRLRESLDMKNSSRQPSAFTDSAALQAPNAKMADGREAGATRGLQPLLSVLIGDERQPGKG